MLQREAVEEVERRYLRGFGLLPELGDEAVDRVVVSLDLEDGARGQVAARDAGHDGDLAALGMRADAEEVAEDYRSRGLDAHDVVGQVEAGVLLVAADDVALAREKIPDGFVLALDDDELAAAEARFVVRAEAAEDVDDAGLFKHAAVLLRDEDVGELARLRDGVAESLRRGDEARDVRDEVHLAEVGGDDVHVFLKELAASLERRAVLVVPEFFELGEALMRIVWAFGEGQLAAVGVPDEVVLARLAGRDDFEAEQLAPRPEVYEVARLVAVDERVYRVVLCCDLVQHRAADAVGLFRAHVDVDALLERGHADLGADLGVAGALDERRDVALGDEAVVADDEDCVLRRGLYLFLRRADGELLFRPAELDEDLLAFVGVARRDEAQLHELHLRYLREQGVAVALRGSDYADARLFVSGVSKQTCVIHKPISSQNLYETYCL